MALAACVITPSRIQGLVAGFEHTGLIHGDGQIYGDDFVRIIHYPGVPLLKISASAAWLRQADADAAEPSTNSADSRSRDSNNSSSCTHASLTPTRPLAIPAAGIEGMGRRWAVIHNDGQPAKQLRIWGYPSARLLTVEWASSDARLLPAVREQLVTDGYLNPCDGSRRLVELRRAGDDLFISATGGLCGGAPKVYDLVPYPDGKYFHPVQGRKFGTAGVYKGADFKPVVVSDATHYAYRSPKLYAFNAVEFDLLFEVERVGEDGLEELKEKEAAGYALLLHIPLHLVAPLHSTAPLASLDRPLL